MSSSEFSPKSFIDIISGFVPHEGEVLSLNERWNVAQATYKHIEEKVQPYMGEWVPVRVGDKGRVIREIRQAESGIVDVDGLPCVFTITEHGKEPNFEFPLPHMYTVSALVIGTEMPLFSVGQKGSYAAGAELTRRSQFEMLTRGIDYIAPRLKKPSE